MYHRVLLAAEVSAMRTHFVQVKFSRSIEMRLWMDMGIEHEHLL